jgi:hypothetical protein
MGSRQHVASQDESEDQNQMKTTGVDNVSSQGDEKSASTSKPTRLSVNISRNTFEALDEITSDNEISMTEAVRRLIGYGIVTYRATKEGYEVLLRREGKIEKIILVD